MSQHSHLYNNNAWRAVRLAQLQKEPLCAFCKKRGVITAATVCDHVDPHKGDLDRFWAGPFQSLCASCHSVDKQILENGGTPKRVVGVDGIPEGW